VGIVPFMGLNFTIYEFLKTEGEHLHSRVSSSGPGISSSTASHMLISGMAGGMAGGMSKLIVYPLDTMKKRMQAQVLANTFQEMHPNWSPSQAQGGGHSSSGRGRGRGSQQGGARRRGRGRGRVRAEEDFSTLRGCFRSILRAEGLAAFYKVTRGGAEARHVRPAFLYISTCLCYLPTYLPIFLFTYLHLSLNVWEC
jgi:hypothetical protein